MFFFCVCTLAFCCWTFFWSIRILYEHDSLEFQILHSLILKQTTLLPWKYFGTDTYCLIQWVASEITNHTSQINILTQAKNKQKVPQTLNTFSIHHVQGYRMHALRYRPGPWLWMDSTRHLCTTAIWDSEQSKFWMVFSDRHPPQPCDPCVSEPFSVHGWRLGNDHRRLCLMLQLCRRTIGSNMGSVGEGDVLAGCPKCPCRATATIGSASLYSLIIFQKTTLQSNVNSTAVWRMFRRWAGEGLVRGGSG